MATGKPPWSQYKNQFTALYYIGHAVDPPPYPAELSPAAHQFLDLIFQRNPRKRSNICGLLHHPFITGGDMPNPVMLHYLLSPEEKQDIERQANNVKPENDVGSLASPNNVKPAIEISDSSLEDSGYITNGKNQKAHFYVVSKAAAAGKGYEKAVEVDSKPDMNGDDT